MMNITDGGFFTVILAILGLAVLSISSLYFPTCIVRETEPGSVKICGFADVWEEGKIALPQLTKWSLGFAKAKTMRHAVAINSL